MSVQTRVEGDHVAVLLKFGKDGELQSTNRASHPVGTTVKVTDFFNSYPVRKQSALKHSAKWLAKIRRLMQAYALARPSIRFQLRILKAKSDQGNFTYVPKKGANVEDAALKAIGRDCVSQCDWAAVETDGFEVRAFLPKPDASGAGIANEGAFLSVDARPMSTARGTPKLIWTKFKEKLRKANPALAAVKDPFMCMNIFCPPNSYDPNVEPAKDNVLFENAELVLSVVDKLLMSYYQDVGENELDNLEPLQSAQAPLEQSNDGSESASKIYLEIDEVSARGCQSISQGELPPSAPSALKSPMRLSSLALKADCMVREDADNEEVQAQKLATSDTQEVQPKWRPSMYGIDEEDLMLLSEDQPPVEDEEEHGRQDIEVSNPWTIAKMNASIKSGGPMVSGQPMTPAKSGWDVAIGSSSPLHRPSGLQRSIPFEPLTPQTSSRTNASMSAGVFEPQSIRRLPQLLPKSSSCDVRDRELIDEGEAFVRNHRGFSVPLSDFIESDSISLDPLPQPGTPPVMIQAAPTPRTGKSYFSKTYSSPIKRRATKKNSNETENWFSNLPTQRRFKQPLPARKQVQRPTLFPAYSTLSDPNGGVVGGAEHLMGDHCDIRNFFGHRNRALESNITTGPAFTPADAHPDIQQSGNDFQERSVTPLTTTDQFHETAELEAQTPFVGSSSTTLSPQPRITTDQRHTPRTREEVDMADTFRLHTGCGPPPSKRRKSAKGALPHRTRSKSIRLMLSYTPRVHQTQDLILLVSVSAKGMAKGGQKLDMRANSVEWGYRAEVGEDGVFDGPVAVTRTREWSVRIANMLDEWYEADEGVDVARVIEEGIMKRLSERRCRRLKE